MSLLRQLEKRGADGRLPWGSSAIPTNAMTGLQFAGVPVNDDTALSLTTVQSCIGMIADSSSSVDLHAIRGPKDRPKIIDPTPQLLVNPWPEGTLQDWITQVVVSMGLRGNFYGQIVDRDEDGYPTTVMPVHPDMVVARRKPDGKREYRFGGKVIPVQDVLHIPLFLLPGQFVGLNPVEYQRAVWGNAYASVRYSGQFFANSANPSGILSTEQDLSPEETLEWVRAWKASHGGIGNAQLPAILTGGAKWQQLSISPNDAQFLETRKFLREEIISWFHITPAKYGIPGEHPPMMEEVQTQYVMDAVVPYLSRIENTMSRPEFTRKLQRARFDYTSLMRANLLQQMQAAQIGANTGLMMTDELRAMQGKEPLPNGIGRVIQRPMNMTAIDVDTGLPVEGQTPDPALKPDNPSGVGEGGGDPDQSPGTTKPDKLV